jgi:ABC-2 type transport system permease protein
MDAAVAIPIRFNRLLPYWAVLQTDVRATLRGWVYRLWLMMMLAAVAGYLLFKLGMAKAGEFQSAAVQTDDLLRALVIGSLSLISLIAVSSISSERGTIADSVLSRGISRYQYFLAKWHARLVVIMSTFMAVGGLVLILYMMLFNETVTGGTANLTIRGGIVGLVVLTAALGVVVSWGVTIGALANGTVIGITLFWMVIFGGLVMSSQLPPGYPNPQRTFEGLRHVLRGEYVASAVSEFVIACVAISTLAAAIGAIGFARRDV